MQGMETEPAPGDTGTDSGTDDDAKQQSAVERELLNHCKRKAAASEGASEAAEATPAQKQQHRPIPEPAGVSFLAIVRPHVEALSCQDCLMQSLCTWALMSYSQMLWPCLLRRGPTGQLWRVSSLPW